MMNSFTLTAENFSDTKTQLQRCLSSLNVADKDSLRTELLVEEIFLRMTNHGGAERIDVRAVKNFFGKVQVQMTAAGVAYNPIVEVTELTEDDDDYYAMMILKANRRRLNWHRNQNSNIVTIDVGDDGTSQMRLLMAAIVGGIVCGFAMKEFLSPETIALITENFIAPIQTMFMNALGMIIAPVIFFSIISGITGMGAGASVGKVGSKLIGMYLSTTAIASCVGLTVARLIFSGDVPQIGAIPSSSTTDVKSYDFSLIQFIVDIVPNNLISPVTDGKVLQIIFLAVLFGSCLNVLGDKVRLLQELVSNSNEFFMKVVSAIVTFVPLIAFLAMINLVVSIGVDVVLTMSKLVAGQLIGGSTMLCVYALIILFIGKISPLPFLKKIYEVWATPLATSSSAVSMPFTMNFCTKRLGISPKITSFSIPVGTTVNMDGGSLYMPVAVMMLLKMYGVEVDWNTMLIILTTTLSVSVGAPAVPNASVIFILMVVAMFGVPNDFAGVLFCLATICDRIVTCFNVTGDVAVATALARTEKLLDEKIYFS